MCGWITALLAPRTGRREERARRAHQRYHDSDPYGELSVRRCPDCIPGVDYLSK